MPNELVFQPGWPEDEQPDEWDSPPVGNGRKRKQEPRERDARSGEKDAAARSGGDNTYASQRVTDARENRQSRGDWGDARTWIYIGMMCVGFLLVTAAVYFLPFGRHNQNDGESPTPSIRVY